MKNGNAFETDWDNIDFTDDFESHLHLIDGLTFDTLFIEIEHNCKVIDEKAVRAQFELDLSNRVREARVLPLGAGGNIICGIKGYKKEMECRKERNVMLEDSAKFDLPAWDSLRVYFSGEKN